MGGREGNIEGCLKLIGREVLDRTNLSEVRAQWQAAVNMVINFLIQYKEGKWLASCERHHFCVYR